MKITITTMTGAHYEIDTGDHQMLDDVLDVLRVALVAEGYVYVTRLEAIKEGEEDV